LGQFVTAVKFLDRVRWGVLTFDFWSSCQLSDLSHFLRIHPAPLLGTYFAQLRHCIPLLNQLSEVFVSELRIGAFLAALVAILLAALNITRSSGSVTLNAPTEDDIDAQSQIISTRN
jgi:hypothetical protein